MRMSDNGFNAYDVININFKSDKEIANIFFNLVDEFTQK